jgi:hypothetical protein
MACIVESHGATFRADGDLVELGCGRFINHAIRRAPLGSPQTPSETSE